MTQPFGKTYRANGSGIKTMTGMPTSSVNNVTGVQLYIHFHLQIVCFLFLLMLLCLLCRLYLQAASPRESPFLVCAWLSVPVSKNCSSHLGLPQLMHSKPLAWTSFSPWSSQSRLWDYRSYKWFSSWFWSLNVFKVQPLMIDQYPPGSSSMWQVWAHHCPTRILVYQTALYEEGVRMSHWNPPSYVQSYSSGAYLYTAYD